MTNGSINCYLAGCISKYYDEGEYDKSTDWRREIADDMSEHSDNVGFKHLGFFDPTINFLSNVKHIEDKEVVDQNNYYLDKCDILIVNLAELEHSPGTIYEIYYYKFKNKPVIAFGDHEWMAKPHISESISVRLDVVSDVVDYLDRLYCQ